MTDEMKTRERALWWTMRLAQLRVAPWTTSELLGTAAAIAAYLEAATTLQDWAEIDPPDA